MLREVGLGGIPCLGPEGGVVAEGHDGGLYPSPGPGQCSNALEECLA